MATRLTVASVLTLLVLAGTPGLAEPQGLQQIKDLYAQAAYEEALGALSALPEAAVTAEAVRYRAACLVALGRTDDARKAVRSAVEEHPDYSPDPADTSPKVLELFQEARRELLPAIARRLYAEARAAMDRKDAAAAAQQLDHVVRLLDSPDLTGDAASADLKLLASGFLDLTRAQVAPPVPEPPAPAPPVEAPRPKAPVMTPAVPIRQTMPQWNPPAGMSRYTDFQGSVRVEIGADGKVVSAALAEPIHPAYDRLLLAAARDWLYQPATLDGVPVPSERTVQVSLKAR